jgi:leucyl aminopeptidase
MTSHLWVNHTVFYLCKDGKMKNVLGLLLLTFSVGSLAAPKSQWLTVDNEVLAKIRPKLNKSVQTLYTAQGASVVKLSASEVEALSETIHHELHRCGGFITHDSFAEAQDALSNQGELYFAKRAIFSDYTIDQKSLVAPMVAQVAEGNIRGMIEKLSSYKTRHYKSDTGVESSVFIRDTWAQLASKRNDVKVELYQHRNWPQASIIMTITGSEKPNEIVILGGHADSIAGMFGGSSSRAPGADDNASGISTITEVIRILMNNSFKPKRTIMFMGYAAEEVGLLGSKDIASSFKAQGREVVGVMQLDMVLKKGTPDKDIVMMADYTNQAQNEFIGRLIDEYVKVPWGYSRCGYGCSDHASWTANGFPASIPFESTMDDINRNIHTAKDTLESSGGDAKHAAKFAKLATAFVVELAN